MKVYIIRHGQVDGNLNDLYKNTDEDLNETGIQQAMELREKIKEIDYDVIYCSPLLRAKHTADIINVKDRNIIIDKRLEERNPGSLSGHPHTDTDRNEYWGYYSKIQYGTSENIISFFDKINSFLDELKTKEYNSVLVVAHSGVSKGFKAYFEGIPEDGNFLYLGLRNCEIKEYEL